MLGNVNASVLRYAVCPSRIQDLQSKEHSSSPSPNDTSPQPPDKHTPDSYSTILRWEEVFVREYQGEGTLAQLGSQLSQLSTLSPEI